MTDHLDERARVYRVLDALGLDRVLDGLAAFNHEPEGTFCHCFATDCFRGEIAGTTRRELGKRMLIYPVLGYRDIETAAIASRIGVNEDDAHLVFLELYEKRPHDLAGYVADWLAAGSYCKAVGHE